jgi:hypothetical protein
MQRIGKKNKKAQSIKSEYEESVDQGSELERRL